MTPLDVPPLQPRPALDELLAQSGWMRALARGLLGDPAEADEVVQDAWLVALTKRSAVQVDLGAWLRTVVRNLALRRRTREARRTAVEQRAARPESGGDAHDAIERMELQRWLAEALLALDEPYRSAVILRHVEGLTPAEIATRQGCSSEAARQRVSRGLERLRRALDARSGGREQWALLVAPLLGRTPAARLPLTVTTGGLLVGSKLLLGSLLALVVVALVWWTRERTPGAPSPENAPTTTATLAAERPAGETPPLLSAESKREALPAAPEVAPEPKAPPSNPLFARLSGRVVDPAHAPIAGASVVVRRPEVGHFSILDVDVRRHPREVARATTDAGGRFAFELERGIPFDLAVGARGFCDELASQRYAGEELELVLWQGYLVHGTVTRARDGAPIESARVRVFQLGGTSANERATTTDARGDYELRFTFAADARLEITPLREMGSPWIPVDPGADGTVRQDVALADGIEVRGRVTEAGSGAPIAGAEIGEGWTFRRSAFTDGLGEYALPGFGVEGVQELYARASGFGKTQRSNLPAAIDGVMRVDFELPRGRSVRGRVLARDARPIEGAYVGAVASEDGAEGQRTDWISGRTDGAGRYDLAGLTPELRHCLLVSAEGFATHVYDFPAGELDEAEVELDDIRLAPPAVLAGTVQDEDGNPVGGMQVGLSGANRDRARFRAESGLAPAAEWYVDSRHATSDARGRFWFGALAPGEYRVRARKAGRPDGPEATVTLGEGELRDGFELLYPRGESIRGVVVDEAGHGLAGVYAIAQFWSQRDGAPGDPRSGRASTRSGATGEFELLGLPPGTYQLEFHPWELESDPDRPWLSEQRERVESGGDPLRIVLPRGVRIRGKVVDPAGAALVGYTVLGNAIAGDENCGSITDADGRFALDVRAGTVWDLEVRGSPQTDAYQTIYGTQANVAAGAGELLLHADPSTPAAPAARSSAPR